MPNRKLTGLGLKIAQAKLQKLLPKGTTVYTLRQKCSGHRFSILCIHDGRIQNITIPALLAAGRNPADYWSEGGYNHNHARSIVEQLEQVLYGEIDALKWESL